MDVSGFVTGSIIRYLRSLGGETLLNSFFTKVGVGKAAASSLESSTSWVSADEAFALFDVAAKVSGVNDIALQVGMSHLKLHEPTGMADLMVSLGSVREVFRNLASLMAKYSTINDTHILEVGDAHAVIRVRGREGYHRDLYCCHFLQGVMSQVPVLFGLVPAMISETECQARGGGSCLYSIAWQEQQWSTFVDESASLFSMAWEEDKVAEVDASLVLDPTTELAQLREQIASLSERLESAYSTAGELLGADDIDTILRKIIQRAGHAVNAPKYLLTVRAFKGEEPQLHEHGFLLNEAASLANELWSGNRDEKDGSRLIVDVSSAQQHYGWLVSVLPERMKFLEHDRRTMTVYAGYAATALDVATSLITARRRDATARALLEFGNALSETKSSQEVSQRLAETVPAVIGAVGAVVMLYDPEKDELIEAARSVPAKSELNLPIDKVRIPPTLIPDFEVLSEQGEPIQMAVDNPDPRHASLLEPWHVASALIAPLKSGDTFIGTIHAGFAAAQKTPAKFSADLRERFMGLANQAVIAFENARLLEQISHMAWHDALTGLPNRRLFEDRVRQELSRAARTGESLTVFYVDLDRFKQVNDTLGHSAGDDLICQVANRLADSVRGQDTVARLGGDEFAVLLPGLSDADVTHRLASRILAALNEPFNLQGEMVQSSGSIGVACTSGRLDLRYEDFIHEADVAMYKAKTLGRNTFETYSEEDLVASSHEETLADDLSKAADEGELEILYQAQIDLHSMKVVGVESLLRWNHPRLGRLLPDAFIDAAEKYGGMLQVDAWVLNQACRQAVAWDGLGLPPLRVGVNLSMGDLTKPEIVGIVKKSLDDTGLDPARLELELSKIVASQQNQQLKSNLENLKRLGVRIAIDDVGRNGSGVPDLTSLDIDTLKIDRHMIHTLSETLTTDATASQIREKDDLDEEHLIALMAITELAREIGADLVGEGVETSYQRDRLLAAGCSVLQGYFFSPPVRARDIVIMVQAAKISPPQLEDNSRSEILTPNLG